MEFTIKNNDVSNSHIESADGSITFQTKTPKKFVSTVTETEITAMTSNGNERPIGKILWDPQHGDTIQPSGGQTVTQDKYLRGKVSSDLRQWSASDGNEYIWRVIDPLELRTIDKPAKILAHHQKGSVLKLAHPKLVVEPDAMHMVDDIILAFAFLKIGTQFQRLICSTSYPSDFPEDSAQLSG